jgi:hypothetical protein
MHSRLGRIGLLISWLVSSPSCGSEPSPAASAAAAAGSAALAEGVPQPGAAAVPAADPAGNAEDGPLCVRYGGMNSVRQVTAQLLAKITGDCRIRAFFGGLTAAGGQRVQDCLSIQIGELFGCAVSYARARADNGLECRDMRTSHIGLGVTAADFAALLEDVGAGLAAAGIDAADIDAAASSLRALAPHIVELPESTAPSRSQCGDDIDRGLEPAEQGP